MSARYSSRVLVVLLALIAAGGVCVGFAASVSAQQAAVDTTDLNGSGTADDPYVITNVTELQAIEDDLSANYTLGNDIDASATAQWNDGSGFTPLGGDPFYDSTPPAFTGSLNGANHTITGLTIDRPESDGTGLFHTVGSAGTIRNVSLNDVAVTGGETAGGLAGKITDSVTVTKASVSGSVTGTGDFTPAGGLVGEMYGDATISNSSAIATVNSTNREAGGLVGENSATITHSAAAGNVSGSQAGGLVGANNGIIVASHAAGNVTGGFASGGLVGVNNGGGTITASYATGAVTGDTAGGLVGVNLGSVAASYATGAVTGGTDSGGIVGANYQGGSIIKSYWDTETTTQGSSDGGATGLTTAEMTGSAAKTNMTGFDFNRTWQTQPDSYPALRPNASDVVAPVLSSFSVSHPRDDDITVSFDSSEPLETIVVNITGDENAVLDESSFSETTRTYQATYVVSGDGTYTATLETATDRAGNDGASGQTGTVTVDITPSDLAGSGTETDPHVITNASELRAIDHSLGANYTLGNDIDAAATATWNDGNGFKPIGTWDQEFTGSFDGANHTIAGLTINRSSTDGVGLFGYVDNGDVTNVSLAQVDVSGSSDVGGLVGDSSQGTVRNAVVTGDVTGGFNVGGLVGSASGTTVRESSADAAVTGGGFAGGLVGQVAYQGTVRNSSADGNVVATDRTGGGLVGGNIGTIRESYATGDVVIEDNYDSAGGLVGKNDGRVSESYANGTVTATRYNTPQGGLVGENQGTVVNSYSTGTVDGRRYVGGLIGRNDGGTVTASYTTASATGERAVGGIAAQNLGSGTINESYAAGTVSASENVYEGGLVGENRGAVHRSYWNTQTTGQSGSAGSATGLTTAEMSGDAARENMVGFDFSNDWRVVAEFQAGNQTVSYPFLQNTTQQPKPGLQTQTGVYADGNGTESSPFEITTWAHLDNVRENPTANFTLGGNLTQTTDGYNTVASPTANSDRGFDPITGSSGFTGAFDGNGYSIQNLTINRSDEDYVGLVGANRGVIENLSVQATISGARDVGGLVGANNGTIRKSSAMGTVSGSRRVGGLVGENNGTIFESYATSAILNGSRIGGLVGTNRGTIRESYASGSVSEAELAGGLVGTNGGTVSASYWDVNTSGRSTSTGGTGLTTAEMKGTTATETMAFNFTDTWAVVDSDGRISYPYLQTATLAEPPGINTVPNANNITYTVRGNEVLSVGEPGVLTNDSDPDGESLTVTQPVRSPSNGTLTLQTNGSFTYTPDTDFVGTDSFTYEIRDGNGGTDTATVTIVVKLPVAIGGDCQTIFDSGEYYLTENLSNATTCLAITADDVVLNGNGYTVAGENVTDATAGIEVTGDNVTVRNLTVAGWASGSESAGLVYRSVTNVTSENVIARQNDNGIVLDNATAAEIANGAARNNGHGIVLNGTTNSSVSTTVLSENSVAGLTVFDGRENELSSNTANESNAVGIDIAGADGTTLAENTVTNNAAGISITGTDTADSALAGNTVTGNSGPALTVTNATNTTVSGLNIGNSTAPDTTLSFGITNATVDSISESNRPEPDSPPNNASIDRYLKLDGTTTSPGEIRNIELGYESDDVPPNTTEESLSLWRFTGDTWEPIPDSGARVADQIVTGNVTNVSTVGAFVEELADPEGLLSSGSVANQGLDASLVEGNQANASVEVTNRGELEGSFDVSLQLVDQNDSTVVLTQNQTTNVLAADQTETVTFEQIADGLSPGTYQIEFTTANDTVAGTVTVQEKAADLSGLAIGGQGTNATITKGETVDVTAIVTNTGDAVTSFDAELLVANTSTIAASSTETTGVLAPGEQERVTFDSVAGQLSAGAYNVNVSTDETTVQGDLRVEQPATLQLQSVTAPDTVTLDENLEVEYTITNVGDTTGTESFVDLLVEGSLVTYDSDIRVDPGETTNGTLVFDTVDAYEPGTTLTFAVELFDAGDSTTGLTTVSLPPVVGTTPPQDLTGDNNYDDINGDGEITPADVQALFSARNSTAVTEYAEYYNFSGQDSSTVTIADIEALFDRIGSTPEQRTEGATTNRDHPAEQDGMTDNDTDRQHREGETRDNSQQNRPVTPQLRGDSGPVPTESLVLAGGVNQ